MLSQKLGAERIGCHGILNLAMKMKKSSEGRNQDLKSLRTERLKMINLTGPCRRSENRYKNQVITGISDSYD
jgi:hypothetical protein